MTRATPPVERRAARRIVSGVIAIGVLAALVLAVVESGYVVAAASRAGADRGGLGGRTTLARRPPRPAPRVALPAGPRFAGRDLVLVTIDALRADHLGAYGYGRPTSPVMDALARDGVLFERAYVPVPATSFSLATLMTGQPVHALAASGAAPPAATVAMSLRRAGYKTAGFFPPAVFFSDAHKLPTLEERRYDFEYVKYEYADAAARTEQVIRFFDTEQPARAFVWLHYFEPHEPYESHPGHEFGLEAIDRYDSEIAYVDRHLGRLVEWLRVRRPGAIVIVTADHGEEFGDHGGFSHGSSLYDEQARVPLIINTPGLPPQRFPMPVATLDLPRTALALVAVPAPAALRGTDLTPWLGASPAPPAAAPPVFSELEHQRLVASGHHKLVCDFKRDSCELYDLAADPRERHNLIDVERATASRLRGELDGWMASRLVAAPRPGERARPVWRARQALVNGRAGDAVAVPELARVLAGRDPDARREAARLLRGLRLPAARAALVRHLDDGDLEVARAAATVAAAESAVARRQARGLLAAAATPVEERLWAAIGLAEAGGREGVPELAATVADACRIVADGSAADGRCAGSADTELARHAVRLLGQLGDPRAVDALLAARANVRLRRDVVDSLGAVGDERVAGVLAAELATEVQTDVRAAIARALRQLGDRRVAPHLASAFARETEIVAARELLLAACDLGGAGAGGAQAVDLRSWRQERPRHVALRPAPGGPAAGIDLWLLAAPGARGQLGVRLGAGPEIVVELDGTQPIVRLAVPAGDAAGRPVRVALARISGDPWLDVVWLRALRPGPTLPPAPASQWVPASQRSTAAGR